MPHPSILQQSHNRCWSGKPPGEKPVPSKPAMGQTTRTWYMCFAGLTTQPKAGNRQARPLLHNDETTCT